MAKHGVVASRHHGAFRRARELLLSTIMSFGAFSRAMILATGVVASACGSNPTAAVTEERHTSERILASGLFGRPPPVHPEPPPGPAPEPGGILPACAGRLVGLVINVRNPRATMASTVGPEGSRILRIGDQDVEKIEPERVLMRQAGGVCELRMFDHGRAARPVLRPPDVIEVATADAQADDEAIARELSTVRAIPRPTGLAIYGIRRGSLLDRLGMKNGDVVVSVGGQATTDVDAMLGYHAALRAGTLERLDAVIERRGERINVTYAFR
jgi:general secretion pathway protein C